MFLMTFQKTFCTSYIFCQFITLDQDFHFIYKRNVVPRIKWKNHGVKIQVVVWRKVRTHILVWVSWKNMPSIDKHEWNYQSKIWCSQNSLCQLNSLCFTFSFQNSLHFCKRSPVSLITWMKAERLHHACMNTAITLESQVGYWEI